MFSRSTFSRRPYALWSKSASGGGTTITIGKATLSLSPRPVLANIQVKIVTSALALTGKSTPLVITSSITKSTLTLTGKSATTGGISVTVGKSALTLAPKGTAPAFAITVSKRALTLGALGATPGLAFKIAKSALTLTPKNTSVGLNSTVTIGRSALILGARSAIVPGAVTTVSGRQYLTIAPYKRLTPSTTPDQSFQDYMMRELKSLQRTLSEVTEGAIQTLAVAPVTPPRYGTTRYATGAWATSLGGPGLYIYKDDNAWHKII